jgi:hypothetical protein
MVKKNLPGEKEGRNPGGKTTTWGEHRASNTGYEENPWAKL